MNQRACDEFNVKYPVGTAVRVKLDNGAIKATQETKTKSKAWMMGGHTAVVLLEGIPGAYALSRVTPA